MGKSGPYTQKLVDMFVALVRSARPALPVLGAEIDEAIGTSPGSRASIVKHLRRNGVPVIGRDWGGKANPNGYFFSDDPLDHDQQAEACRKKASSYIADAELHEAKARELRQQPPTRPAPQPRDPQPGFRFGDERRLDA